MKPDNSIHWKVDRLALAIYTVSFPLRLAFLYSIFINIEYPTLRRRISGLTSNSDQSYIS